MEKCVDTFGVTVAFCIIFLLVCVNAKAEERASSKECVTHTVINHTSNLSNTITRCRNEMVTDFSSEQSENQTAGIQPSRNHLDFEEPFNSFSELDSQISIASSSHRIIWLTVIGSFINAIGLGLLFLTTRQNSNTLKHIKSVSALELKPYLSGYFIEATPFCWDPDEEKQQFGISIEFENFGKTPASDLYISIRDASLIFKNDAQIGHVNFKLNSGAMIATKYHIQGDKSEVCEFTGTFVTKDISAWRKSGEEGGRFSLVGWTCIDLELHDVTVRYKDLECEGTARHKCLKGSFNDYLGSGVESRDVSFRIRENGWGNDGKHDHYKRQPKTKYMDEAVVDVATS